MPSSCTYRLVPSIGAVWGLGGTEMCVLYHEANPSARTQGLSSERCACVLVYKCPSAYLSAVSLLCRQQRLAEWKATQLKNKFGEVLEISGKDYVQEVTRAGEGLWVILHLYKQG